MFRWFLNRLKLTIASTGGRALRSDSAELYLDAPGDSCCVPELVLLRSIWP
jgi:hypothetical protein